MSKQWQKKLSEMPDIETLRIRVSLGASLISMLLITIAMPVRHLITPLLPLQIVSGLTSLLLCALGTAIIVQRPTAQAGRYAILIALMIFPIVGGYGTGGLDAPIMPILVIFPIMAAFCLGKRAAVIFALIAFAVVAGLFVAKSSGALPPTSLTNESAENQAKFVIFTTVLIFALSIAFLYERTRVAELKAREQLDLAKAKGMRHAKLASLGEMAAGMAHEINNPLAIISGSVDTLVVLTSSATPDPERVKSRLATIKKSVERIARIVGSLRRFSRSDSDQPHQEHHLPDLIREAMILTEAKARQHSTNVSVTVAGTGTIRCNDIEIEQVIVNLINNAIDAVKDQPDRWVRITVQEDNASVVLRVRDSGTRIAPEIQQRMFQPFFTTKPVGEGTGLGLSIIKGILDDHKATIDLIADDPHTCFEIRFAKASPKDLTT